MNIKSAATIIGLAALLSSIASAQTGTPGVVAVTPDEIRWDVAGGLALPGMARANLVGDPTKPGPYTLRLKFPAGYKLAPHTHPDSREVTILSGTWYTEPANLPHFVETRGDVLIQVSGTGPSGRKFVNPEDNPK